MPKEHVLLWSAIHELKIDVPILRHEIIDGQVILYLYGGQVVSWSPSDSANKPPAVVGKTKPKTKNQKP
jgi:hypothetical protein